MAPIDERAFTQRWIRDVIASMDAHLDEDLKRRVLESCGRACARSGPVHAAKQHQGDLDGWLDTLRKWHGGEEHVRSDGNVVRVTCGECVCPAVKDMPEAPSGTFCGCSLGWMKETFGTVVGHPVEVELVESVVRGGEQCQFLVHVA